MKGFIRTNCDNCGKQLRVEVNFPDLKSKFENTVITCEYCKTELLITDSCYTDEQYKEMEK